MGKRGYNWKARKVYETKVDDAETQKIQIELPVKEYGSEDASNALVLPSNKRATQVKKEKLKNIKILSKKQRKQLEKIVDKKKKKENRASLLEALSKVQITNDELAQMTSISAIQSKGLKNHLSNASHNLVPLIVTQADQNSEPRSLKSISGSTKRKYLLSLEPDAKKKKTRDLNVVGFEESSSEDDDDNVQEEIKDDSPNPINEEPAVKDEEQDDDVQIIDHIVDNVQIEKSIKRKSAREKRKEQNTGNDQPDDKYKIKLPKRETIFVEINRNPEIQAARLKLPILAEEQSVVDCINNNAIVIIAGETGSGKTTQIPQFLYEAGYAQNKLIGVTEPRRVAAVAMSQRVAEEMSLTSREVSYLMRYEGNVSSDTKIKFMTDGVLLKEIESDFLLTKYSVIIVDEAHERSVFTDILIGLLSRIVPLRCKKGDALRFIIMSATLRVEDFTQNSRLFKYPPPVINIESRQFPVTVHFNKRTEEDYLKAAFSKTIKIHTKLPEGGILIFVTGQSEVRTLVNKLRSTFPYKPDNKSKLSRNNIEEASFKNSKSDESDNTDDDMEMMMSMKKMKKSKSKERKKAIDLPKIDLDDFDIPDDEVDDDRMDKTDCDELIDSEDEREWENLASSGIATAAGPLWVLPLYSMLSPTEQAKVFQAVPDGCRLCVVATNVAETSLTIPDVKYVVDTGKQKIRVYERVTGVSAMRVVWISKASAEQRAGRAGRCGPGHCYRLYSSAIFEHEFCKDKEPEIRTRPIDDLVLQMKCMGIDKVVNFPFPSAPDLLQFKCAEVRLKILGALKKAMKTTKEGDDDVLQVSDLGHAISGYPVLPRYGKMLALSHQHDLFQYTLCMVAALSVQEVLIALKRKYTAVGESLLLGDPGKLLNIVGAAEHAALSGEDMEVWCNSQGVRWRALREIRLLRGQLAGTKGVPPAPREPPGILARPLRQILLAGLGDSVARKLPLSDIKENADKIKFKYAYNIPDMEEPVYMHSGSVLRKELPEWVIYQEIYQASEGDDGKMIMRGVTAIEPEWLPVYVPDLCNLGEPLSEPAPRYDVAKDRMLCHVNATFGRSGWSLPTVEINFPESANLFRWFAIFVLDGTVIKKLKKYTKNLLAPPQTMIKAWAKLQPRTELFYRSLSSKQISSKSALLKEWQSNPNYLLDIYKKWLPESSHDEISLFWPPIN